MVTDNRNRLRDRAGGESPAGSRAGRFGRPGRGQRRAAFTVVAAGAAAFGAMLAVPASFGPGRPGLAATSDAALSGGEPARAAASGVPRLAWTSCDDGLQCATAQVPLNYRQPGGVKIRIQLIRHLATDRAHRIGSLFVNSGGPSPQVDVFTDEIYPALPAALRERYDIITFDPRGFGHSTAIRCFSSAAAENAFFAKLPAFPVGPAQEAAWERTFARLGALCGERNGRLLDHDTSADVARDMDLLRRAVGDPVMNYIGVSYGTGIGEVYANLFPGKVGHMLLDASLDPLTWSSSDGALPVSLRDGTARAAAKGMNGFLTLCGQASTSACAFSAGSPAATRAKWNTLLDRLRRHQVTIGPPAQAITYADVIAASPPQQTAQWPQAAAELQLAWTASGKGTAGTGTSSSALPSAYNGAEQSLALKCADSSNPRSPRRYPAIARNAAVRFGGFGALQTWDDEPCAQWPGNGAHDRYTGPWNRPTANPVLVFGNTGDTAVSYRDSVAAARHLGDARLLTIDQFGHTEGLNPDTCAASYEVGYMLTGALPPAGTVCKADGPPFPAP